MSLKNTVQSLTANLLGNFISDPIAQFLSISCPLTTILEEYNVLTRIHFSLIFLPPCLQNIVFDCFLHHTVSYKIENSNTFALQQLHYSVNCKEYALQNPTPVSCVHISLYLYSKLHSPFHCTDGGAETQRVPGS